jgi:pyridoxine kinase
MEFRGPGDVISALFLARYLRSGSLSEATSLAAASVFGMLERTADAGARELALIAAQDEIVAPTHKFAAERI